jgi:Ca2+-binding EF-hand superfamily protein
MKTPIGTTAAIAALALALAGSGAAFAAETERGVHFGPGAFGDIDQNQDGYISSEEAGSVWSRLDADDDGRVSAAEYDAYLQRRTGEQPGIAATDYQTQVSQAGREDEGLAVGERVVPPGVPRDPRTGATVDQGMQPGVFRGGMGGWEQADADNDGSISQIEFNRYIADLGEGAWNVNREVHFGPGAFTDEVFGEGGVPDEQALRNAWPRLDANDDGVLDRSEFAAFEETIEMR